MIDFITSLVQMLYSAHETLTLVAQNVSSYSFTNSPFLTWIGYARYAMGDPLFIGFSGVCIISAGMSLYKLILNGVNLFRQICKI